MTAGRLGTGQRLSEGVQQFAGEMIVLPGV